MPGAESSSEKVASGSGGGSAANGPSSSTTTPSHMQSQGTGGGGSGGAGGAGAANAEYRVVVFGAAGVGKTSLVLRFVRGTFRETYVPTIEDTYRQVISCNKQVCTLQITDTTGTHQFPAMQRLSMSKGHAFLLVYSIASRQSLEELRPIVTELVSVRGGQAALAEVPLMLVGNKCDENNNREVSVAEGVPPSGSRHPTHKHTPYIIETCPRRTCAQRAYNTIQ